MRGQIDKLSMKKKKDYYSFVLLHISKSKEIIKIETHFWFVSWTIIKIDFLRGPENDMIYTTSNIQYTHISLKYFA